MYKLIKFLLTGFLFFILMGSPACDGGMDDLGHGYRFYYDNHVIWKESSKSKDGIIGYKLYIPERVLEYDYDSRFIIARQNCLGRFPDAGDDDFPFFCRIPFRKDSITFWLIDKATGFNSGPMDTTSFSNLCAEMGVKLKFGKDDQGSCIKRLLEWLIPETKTQKENCDE